MRSRSVAPLVLALACLLPARAQDGPAPAGDAPAGPAAATGWAGAWDTTFGRLDLEQEGARVRGAYPAGEVEGQVAGRRLTFRYTEADVAGEGWFELSPDGRTFAGRWRERGGDERAWKDWAGTRLPPPDRFDGLFETGYGPLRLEQVGAKLSGSYRWEGSAGTLDGAVEGGRATFRWVEGKGQGTGWFEVEGDALRGGWRAGSEGEFKPWEGTRRRGAPGARWLFVLEAHWEHTLEEPEYAFGDMLAAYFRRQPQVQVRRRRFHDRVDLLRALEELPFLPGPVVLLVAAHGTEGKLAAGPDDVPASALAPALDRAPNVTLLHFSSCDMLTGPEAGKLRAGLTRREALPVSGYATAVDWSASALLEMLYLDLVLGRGYAPGKAAAVVRRELRFAGDAAQEGSPLGAARFRFLGD